MGNRYGPGVSSRASQGDEPTIRDRRHPNSPCPPLDKLGCLDPHPSPWLRRWLYQYPPLPLQMDLQLLWTLQIWVTRWSPVRFRPKPRQLKSMWIWANRLPSKGSKLLFPVIKAMKIKILCVLLCFIKPILGNRYGPGVSSSEPRARARTHDSESLTYLLNLLTPVARSIVQGENLSNLKARSCKLYRADFVGCNWVIQVNSWLPKNGNQGSLYLYTMPGGFFPVGLSCQKPARLALPETRPILFGKIPGGIFELNETQTNPER